jgi:hypothetical protein
MKLRFLDLSNNDLRQIEPEAFKGLTKPASRNTWKKTNNSIRQCLLVSATEVNESLFYADGSQ